MSLSVQHLSDEAVAAFADGMLGGSSRVRAQRHIEGCAECALAVTIQREAARALRSATPPLLPAGLLERLRQVPLTTSLASSPMSLAPDGSPVFPAFGTVDGDPDGGPDGGPGRSDVG
ncbi:MAG TPA: anti-sigma factor, partial [Jatrophihabitantaceae bacterium]|nr:anti-sigma factor [Jatrophihabitantaceae bacterium]